MQDQWVCNIGATDGYVNNGCDLQKGKDGRDTVILEIKFFRRRATVVVRVISRVEKKTESLTGLFGKKPNYQSIFAMEFGHRECDFVYKMYHGVTSLPFLIVIVT